MSTLKGQFIADTYPYLLKTDGISLSSGNQAIITDGTGQKSSLQIGLSGSGAKISGPLSAGGYVYPTSGPGSVSVLTSNGTSQFLSLSTVEALFSLLGGAPDGTYENPTLTLLGGIITEIRSGTSISNSGLSSFTTVGNSVFVVPPSVRRVKFTVTGGGGAGPRSNGGAGGTIIGFLTTTPGQQIGVTIGRGGIEPNGPGGQSNFSIDGNTIAFANGGNTTNSGVGLFGGGSAGINNGTLVQNYYIIPGGAGGVEADGNQNNEAATGAASFWGTGPAYGGGSSADEGKRNTFFAGSGIILFEW